MKNVSEIINQGNKNAELPAWLNMRHAWSASDAKRDEGLAYPDNVIQMTQGAFNALLKTLEEPPAYVIFILATTESHKIPITISSRCQKYEFRRISVETISDRLMELRRGIERKRLAK